MKYLFSLLFPFLAQAQVDCSKHRVYCQIIKNKPQIDKAYAFELSNIIYKESKKIKINPKLFTAILMQESGYKLDTKNCTWGLLTVKYINKDTKFEGRVCTDYGISQIYYKTAKRYKFNINKLLTDLTYSVKAGLIVLKYFKDRYSKFENNWWTRYNCGTKPSTKRRTCQEYQKLVKRWM